MTVIDHLPVDRRRVRQWRRFKRFSFRYPYRVLLAISLLSFGFYLLLLIIGSSSQLLLDFSGRLSASVFGAYLASIFIDGTFREIKEEKDRKTKIIAHHELSVVLEDQQRLILKLYKAAASSPPDRDKITNMRQLVESDEFEEIRMLDFSRESSGIAERNRIWLEEIQYRHRALNEAIDTVLTRYTHVLSPTLIGQLYTLANPAYMDIIDRRLEGWDEESSIGVLLGEHEYKMFDRYMGVLMAVCDKTNNSFESMGLTILDPENTYPEFGQDRLWEDKPMGEAVQAYQEYQKELAEQLRIN